MNQLPFYTRLTLRLAAGVERLDDEYRRRVAAFLWSTQNETGGFVGRKGDADIYYTSFALRSLGLLGEPFGPEIGNYLTQTLEIADKKPLSGTELVSLLFCTQLWSVFSGQNLFEAKTDWPIRQLERFRCDDGGYASSEKTKFSSTYHTFLVLGLLEHVAPDLLPEAETLRAFLEKRQKEDGGFVELEPLKNSGTNPTVAGIGLLSFLRNRFGESLDEQFDKAFRFLRQRQLPQSGFQANGKIPAADLLSTFTALSVFVDNDRTDTMDIHAAYDFVRSMQRAENDRIGYVGGPWDKEPDVEYTFYGLAAECLTAQ